jgi:hypothetical protein
MPAKSNAGAIEVQSAAPDDDGLALATARVPSLVGITRRSAGEEEERAGLTRAKQAGVAAAEWLAGAAVLLALHCRAAAGHALEQPAEVLR